MTKWTVVKTPQTKHTKHTNAKSTEYTNHVIPKRSDTMSDSHLFRSRSLETFPSAHENDHMCGVVDPRQVEMLCHLDCCGFWVSSRQTRSWHAALENRLSNAHLVLQNTHIILIRSASALQTRMRSELNSEALQLHVQLSDGAAPQVTKAVQDTLLKTQTNQTSSWRHWR